jgi:hypothetical protein
MLIPKYLLDKEWVKENEENPYHFYFRFTLLGKLCHLILGRWFTHYEHVTRLYKLRDLNAGNPLLSTNRFVKLKAIVVYRESKVLWGLWAHTETNRGFEFPNLHKYLRRCMRHEKDLMVDYDKQYYYSPFRRWFKPTWGKIRNFVERGGGVMVTPVYSNHTIEAAERFYSSDWYAKQKMLTKTRWMRH